MKIILLFLQLIACQSSTLNLNDTNAYDSVDDSDAINNMSCFSTACNRKIDKINCEGDITVSDQTETLETWFFYKHHFWDTVLFVCGKNIPDLFGLSSFNPENDVSFCYRIDLFGDQINWSWNNSQTLEVQWYGKYFAIESEICSDNENECYVDGSFCFAY